jgi:hypothetical protein
VGGLISNLIGQELSRKQQEATDDAGQLQQQLQMYGYLVRDPNVPAPIKAAAQREVLGLAEKHGGSAAKKNMAALGQYLTTIGQISNIAAQGSQQTQTPLPDTAGARPAPAPAAAASTSQDAQIASPPARVSLPGPWANAPTAPAHPGFRQRLGNFLTTLGGITGYRSPEQQAQLGLATDIQRERGRMMLEPLAISMRHREGQIMGLTGESLQYYALTGQLPSGYGGFGLTGTEKEVYYKVPEQRDQAGNVMTPAGTKIMLRNSRNPDELIDPNSGARLTLSQIGQRGWEATDKPPSERPAKQAISARDPFFRQYIQQHPEFGIDLNQIDPSQTFEVWRHPGGEFVGQPTMSPMSASQSRTLEAQFIDAARRTYRQANGQPISEQMAGLLGARKFNRFQQSIMQRREQEMGIAAYKTGVAPPQLEESDEELAALGLTRIEGAPRITEQSIRAAAEQSQPSQAQPQAPAEVQPPAAGFPPATPRPAVTPQAPAPPRPTAGAPTPSVAPPTAGGVAPESKYVGDYLTQVGSGKLNDSATRGRNIVFGRTGLSEGNFAEAEIEYGSNNKSIGTQVQQANAMQRFLDQVDIFAGQASDAARGLVDVKMRYGNMFVRDVINMFTNDPKFARYKVAATALQRAYTVISSGATQSKGQLHEGATQRSVDSISEYMTFRQFLDVVDQIHREGDGEAYTFALQLWQIQKRQEASPIGKGTGYKAPPPPALPARLQKRPADGTIVTAPGNRKYQYHAATDEFIELKKK